MCRRCLFQILAALLFFLDAVAVEAEDKTHYPALFERAASEFGVPAQVLKGIAFAETRWSHLSWAPGDTAACNGMPRPYGIMSLWDNDCFGHSLQTAAALIGESPDVLKRDPQSNIRGAAALLRKLRSELPLPEARHNGIESWRNAVASYCGLPQEELAQQHALDVLSHISRGYHKHGIEWTGEPVNLEPAREAVRKIKERKQRTPAAAADAAPGAIQEPEIVAAAQPDYPGAIWRQAYPGHWYSSGNGRYFVVIHDMEGYYLSTISYFQRSNTQASIHYCVNGLMDSPTDSPRGEVTQMVEEKYWAWHARCWNTWMLGIEHEGFVSDPAWYTEEQYQASAQLTRYLCDKYGIPKDRNHIIGHGEHLNATWRSWVNANFPGIDPTCNDHTDPGANWNWTHYMQLVNSGNPPIIATQPANQVRDAGQTATFSVSVTGTGPFGYQWKRNGTNIPNGGKVSGATTATLTVTNVQLADAAFYSVTVTNAGASVLSQPGQLVITTTPVTSGSGSGLRAHVFDNMDFTSLKRSRIDPAINFDWADGSPSSTTDPDTFSVRWTGQVQPRYSQTYTFFTRTDDGVRLWVNGTLLIDHFSDQGATEWSGNIALTAGQKYDLRMDYYENTGAALAQLSWSSASQVKEIIPAPQLYRPPLGITPVGNRNAMEGSTLTFAVAVTNFDAWLSSQPITDFEEYADATDSVMFRYPEFSGTTDQFLEALETNYTTVVAAVPAGNSSSRVLKARWAFTNGLPNPWLRLTTAGAPSLPNPMIDFSQSLWFDLYTERPIRLAIGARETGSTAAIGADGGTIGGIEFVGAGSVQGGAPLPMRSIVAGNWTTVRLDFPREPIAPFVGNGVLESTNNKGTLEHLAIVPQDGSGIYRVYLDNFVVVQSNRLTFSLDSGAPAGASINAETGVFIWIPDETQGPGTYSIRVRVTDAGTPSITATNTFVVTVGESNSPPTLAAIANYTLHAGSTLTMTNQATDGDLPANTLLFSLDPGAPPTVTLQPGNGLLTWTTPDVSTTTAYPMTVRVVDNGNPSRSDAKSFTVTVVPRPRASVQWNNGTAALSWSAISGQRYRLQYKSDLDGSAWIDLGEPVTANGPTASLVDGSLDGVSQRFYRVVTP